MFLYDPGSNWSKIETGDRIDGVAWLYYVRLSC